jgi:hypothetical protein
MLPDRGRAEFAAFAWSGCFVSIQAENRRACFYVQGDLHHFLTFSQK